MKKIYLLLFTFALSINANAQDKVVLKQNSNLKKLFDNEIKAKKALNNLKIKYPKFWLTLAKTV